jgi:hypothetical protein
MEEHHTKQHLKRAACIAVHVLAYLMLVMLMVCNIGVSFLLMHPGSCDVRILKLNESDFCHNFGRKL